MGVTVIECPAMFEFKNGYAEQFYADKIPWSIWWWPDCTNCHPAEKGYKIVKLL